MLGMHSSSGVHKVALMNDDFMSCDALNGALQPSVCTPVVRVDDTAGEETPLDDRQQSGSIPSAHHFEITASGLELRRNDTKNPNFFPCSPSPVILKS